MNLDEYFLEPERFDLKTALQAFALLTDFLEYDGITLFEDKHNDPDHSALSEMT
jgi:hypothetical protein